MPFGIITGTVILVVLPRVRRWQQSKAQAKLLQAAPSNGTAVIATNGAAAKAVAAYATYTVETVANAKVVSDLPGRTRLRIPQLWGDCLLSHMVQEHLAQQPGVRQVKVNPATGSVLIVYNPRIFRVSSLYQPPDGRGTS